MLDNNYYIKRHIELLIDKLAEAYKKVDFLEYDDLKQQIRDLRELLNEREVTLSIRAPRRCMSPGPSLSRVGKIE